MGSENEVESILKAFDEFDNYVKNINSENVGSKHDGYLINLKKFEELKEKLEYYKIKNKYLSSIDKEKFKLEPEDSIEDFLVKINCDFFFNMV